MCAVRVRPVIRRLASRVVGTWGGVGEQTCAARPPNGGVLRARPGGQANGSRVAILRRLRLTLLVRSPHDVHIGHDEASLGVDDEAGAEEEGGGADVATHANRDDCLEQLL